MNIYLVEDTGHIGYDQFTSAVVIARSEEEAKVVHLGLRGGTLVITYLGAFTGDHSKFENDVICASFNAG